MKNPNMSRITIDITPELHKQLKLIAVEQGVSVAEIVRRALLYQIEEQKNEQK